LNSSQEEDTLRFERNSKAFAAVLKHLMRSSNSDVILTCPIKLGTHNDMKEIFQEVIDAEGLELEVVVNKKCAFFKRKAEVQCKC
jgi:dethiobiotin synthetase